MPSTVATHATLDRMATVDTMAADSSGHSVPLARCRPADSAEAAHTRAEHALYLALWNLGLPGQDLSRDVSIGYDKLAVLARASKRHLQRLTASLAEKLALEVVGQENSRLRQGKTYRVYGIAEILRRRREAGYLWYLRD